MAPNDNLANAATITGASAHLTASNIGATIETNEPQPNADEATLWWTWTAPSDGYVSINTVGSNFDNNLAVYQGANYSTPLDRVGFDHGSQGQNASGLAFPVKAGQVFKIQVGGVNLPPQGTIVLNLQLATLTSVGITNSGAEFYGAPVPFNDNLSSASTLAGSDLTAVGFNESAGTERSEPQPNVSESTLWWSWTAPSDGFVTIDTVGSNFDNVLSAYQGTTYGTPLNLVDTDHASLGVNQSQVAFPVKAGQVFKIQVGGFNLSPSGTVILNLHLGTLASAGITHTGTQFVGAPTVFNDNFASAAALTASSLTAVGFNLSAGTEATEPKPASLNSTLWWSWTAPLDGYVTIDTIGSSFNNVLDVFQGTMLTGLNIVATNNDGLGFAQSQVKFPVKAGQVFKIQVGSANGVNVQGTILLNIQLGTLASDSITHSGTQYYGAPGTFNDDFNNAKAIFGNTFTAVGFNGSASTESGEPPINVGRTLWWIWEAPASGTVTINTIGTTFDNVLSVYQGSVVSALTTIATNHNGLGTKNGLVQSQVQFAVTANTTYKIQVGTNGNGGATGTVLLNLNLPVAAGGQTQTISFPAIAPQSFGTGPVTFTPTATASSGLPVTFTVTSNPVTVSAGVVTLTNSVTIVASQPGDSTYAAAKSVTQVVVLK